MNDERIHLIALGSSHSMRRNNSGATHYANVQGIQKHRSVGVYFNAAGEVIACTIYDGKDAQVLLSKLHSEIARRGLFIPGGVQ
jgi:hypothetical protein